jgi:site-specific recombinase XerD
MVAAMVLGGLRRFEVIGLRLSDLRMAERRVFIAEGKGGHQRLGRCHVVCVNTSMEVSTDDGCCGIRTWDAGGVRAGA